MSMPDPEKTMAGAGGELPDYSEEPLQQPVKEPWFKDPRKRRIVLRCLAVLILLLCSLPVYRGLKEWRATFLMKKSGDAFSVGDVQQGISLLKQALALAPGSPSIQQGVELYNARAGDAESFDKLLVRMRKGQSDDQELLGIAEIAAMTDRKNIAMEALGLLSPKSRKREFLRRSLLEASLIVREGNPGGAADFCIGRSKQAPSAKVSGYLRIQACLDLLSSRNAPDITRILDLLRGVIKDRSEASIAAWRVATELVLNPRDGAGIPDPAAVAVSLAEELPALSGKKPADELLAADLRLMKDPSLKQDLVAKLIKGRRLSPRTDQLDLARWLNGKGCPREVIAMAGPDRPSNDTDWLLVVLDAKCVLNELNDIPAMLDSPAGSGIQEAVRHLYLARIAMLRGEERLAEEEWRNVTAALHLEKPETLAYIAGYEEQIGAYERAARTYREMADRESTTVRGLIGLILCQPSTAPATKLIPMYEELVAAMPGNQDAACDLAYLRLLAKDDTVGAAASAESLLQSQPNVLTRISVTALGRLRTGDAKGALDLYRDKQIDWNAAAAPWRAIRYAVLMANQLQPEATSIRGTIDPSVLRPEERALLEAPSSQ